jgi:hypothetical protein
MNTVIEEIKEELRIIKNLKHIQVLDFEILQKEENLNGKKILRSIVEKLDLKLVSESKYQPHINVYFKDDPNQKIYSLEIKCVQEWGPNELKIQLAVYYDAPEHTSMECNKQTEFISDLDLKDKTDEEIANWFLSLRGKKKTVDCYYCGQINVHH